MNLQNYALTGRKTRPDYVGVINANLGYLPRKKELADTEEYRKNLLALEEKGLDIDEQRIANETQLAKDALEANKKSSDTANLIGLGQLGASTYMGAKKNKEVKKILDVASGGGGGKSVTGTVPSSYGESDAKIGAGGYAADVATTPAVPTAAAPKTTDFWSGVKGGAKDIGTIAASSLVGGALGRQLGEKYVPIGGQKEKRIIGGAATAGALSYLSSGDPYTAGISALLGGAFGGWG